MFEGFLITRDVHIRLSCEQHQSHLLSLCKAKTHSPSEDVEVRVAADHAAHKSLYSVNPRGVDKWPASRSLIVT